MKFPQSKRMKIFRRDNFTCQYCGLDTSTDWETWYYANLSVDHVNPKGGAGDSNLITSCHTCNSIRHSHPCEALEEARALVADKRKESLEWFNTNVKTSS